MPAIAIDHHLNPTNFRHNVGTLRKCRDCRLPCAGPRDEAFAGWKTTIAAPEKCPNVVGKVGGIQMVVNGYGWHERKSPPTSDELLSANRDWYLYTIDQFGPSRC